MPLPALAQCLDDYHVNQSWQPHNLSARQMGKLNQYAQNGQAGKGWHLLGRLGDRYAALAANVIEPIEPSPGELLHRYVHRHWENTIGPEKTAAFFLSFARQHFRQYIEILNRGTWPDGDQILNSYLAAARKHGLPDLIVFDAAWTASDFSHFVSWQALNLLPPGRFLEQSRICLNISREDANRSLARDLDFDNRELP